MAATATAVSAALRRGGLLPVPRGREGVHVTRGYAAGIVNVTIGIEGPRAAARVAERVAEILAAAGYTAHQHGAELTLFRVTR